MGNKFVMSFSGGKDSTLALYRMIKKGYEPVALLITVNVDKGDSWVHSLDDSLISRISKSLDIPMLYSKCRVEDYEEKFEKALKEAKDLGATSCAFGDIDIADHRKWDEDRCKSVGLDPVFPLWNEDRESIVLDFINSGFTAVIKKVNLEYLNESYLGKVLTKDVLEDIKATGCDCCGEYGEYHTVVIDGPIFNKKVEIKIDRVNIKDSYGDLLIN